MLYSAGSVWIEQKLTELSAVGRNLLHALLWTALIIDAVLIGSVTLPFAAPNSAWPNAL